MTVVQLVIPQNYSAPVPNNVGLIIPQSNQQLSKILDDLAYINLFINKMCNVIGDVDLVNESDFDNVSVNLVFEDIVENYVLFLTNMKIFKISKSILSDEIIIASLHNKLLDDAIKSSSFSYVDVVNVLMNIIDGGDSASIGAYDINAANISIRVDKLNDIYFRKADIIDFSSFLYKEVWMLIGYVLVLLDRRLSNINYDGGDNLSVYDIIATDVFHTIFKTLTDIINFVEMKLNFVNKEIVDLYLLDIVKYITILSDIFIDGLLVVDKNNKSIVDNVIDINNILDVYSISNLKNLADVESSKMYFSFGLHYYANDVLDLMYKLVFSNISFDINSLLRHDDVFSIKISKNNVDDLSIYDILSRLLFGLVFKSVMGISDLHKISIHHYTDTIIDIIFKYFRNINVIGELLKATTFDFNNINSEKANHDISECRDVERNDITKYKIGLVHLSDEHIVKILTNIENVLNLIDKITENINVSNIDNFEIFDILSEIVNYVAFILDFVSDLIIQQKIKSQLADGGLQFTTKLTNKILLRSSLLEDKVIYLDVVKVWKVGVNER